MHLKLKVTDRAKKFYANRINHKSDSGFDLHIPRDYTIERGELAVRVDHGVCASATDSHGLPCGFIMVPRSSMAKSSLRMSNSIGIIDKDYRGELIGLLDNIEPDADNFYEQVNAGARLFQIVAFDGSEITYEFVDELSETSRGEGGYGSTGE